MKTRKIVALLLCAVLLVGASVMGTLAYLTAETNTVENTFQTAGKVHFDDDPETTDLNEGLTESYVDVYGEKYLQAGEGDNAEPVVVDNQADADRVNGNEYKLMPGHTYIKDPELKIAADSEACYVFVQVNNDIEEIEAASTADHMTIKDQMTAGENAKWVEIDATNHIYAYKQIIEKDAADKTAHVFNEFTVAAKIGEGEDAVDVDADMLKSYVDADAKITIKAFAVQADGFATTKNEDGEFVFDKAEATKAWTEAGFTLQ